MKNVYLLGHGFLNKNDKFFLNNDVKFYCPEGVVYSGPKTKTLIDFSQYDEFEGYPKLSKKGTIINEHYFVSESASRADMKECRKYNEALTKGEKWEKRVLYNLFSLSPDIILLDTLPKHAIKLSSIISSLKKEFMNESDKDFVVHWTACRSLIYGSNFKEVLDEMNTGKDGEMKIIMAVHILH